jgi:hypothetical protein
VWWLAGMIVIGSLLFAMPGKAQMPAGLDCDEQ